MSWVKKKLVCIICLKRFEIEIEKKRKSSEEPVKDDNCGTSDSPILLDDDEVSVLPVHQDDGNGENIYGESGSSNSDLYKRFLMFINQYFKLRIFTDRLITSAKNANGAKLETFCEKCAELVSEICNIYKEIQTAKLLLAWKLSQVGQLIRKSKVPMSSKLTQEVKLSLKKQMNLDAVRPVDIFRASLRVNCTNALTAGLPEVIMHRGLFPDEWKFTYSATKEALIRIITIFILGSTRYATYHRKDIDAHNSLKNLGSQRPCPKSKKRVKVSTDPENHLNGTKLTIIVKNEPETENIEETEAVTNNGDADDDNRFSGSDHDDDFPEPENPGNDSDSDWSQGGAASPMSATSDIPSDSEEGTSKKLRWNLRGRRNLIVRADEDGEEDTDGEAYEKPKYNRRKLFIAKSNDSNNPGYKCPQCPKVCKDLRGVSLHVYYFHRSSVHYNCKKCGMRFKRAMDLQLHNKNAHAKYNAQGLPIRGREPIASTCPKCGEVYPSRTELYLHKKVVHGMGEMRRRDTIRRRNRIPGGKFVCKVCGVKCVDSIALAAHSQGHDDDAEVPVKNKKGSRGRGGGKRVRTAKLVSEQKEIDKLLDPASPPPPGKAPDPWYKNVTVAPGKECENMKKKFMKLSCEVENCGETLKSAYLLRKHLEKDHEEDKPETVKNIQCYHCYKRFCYRQSHEIHVRAEHKNKIYGDFKCDQENCSEGAFISTEELNDHLKTHLGDDGKEFKEILFCGKCDWGFLRPEIRDLHQLIHLAPDKHGSFPCPLCDNTYTPHFLRYHFNKEHGSNLRQFKCDECESTFFTQSSVKYHKKIHERRRNLDPEEKLMCVQCGVYVKDFVNLEMHMKNKHNTHPSDRYTCKEPFCGQRFSTGFKLKCHTKRQHGTRDFECKECGQAFYFKNHLNEHYKRHKAAEDGGCPCEKCGKVFRSLVLVKRHMNTVHKKDRKLSEVCSLCGKSFYTPEGLTYHFDSNHKPESEWHLKCPTCPRRFYRSAFLRIHEKKCDGSGVVVTRPQKKVDGGESKKISENEEVKSSSLQQEGNSLSVQQPQEFQHVSGLPPPTQPPTSSSSEYSGIPNFPQMQFHQPFINPYMEPPSQ